MKVSFLLRSAALAICFGWMLYGWNFGFPIRTLVWDENWWSWFAQAQGYTWEEWVTDEGVDYKISAASSAISIFYMLAGLLILLRRKLLWGVVLVSFLLLIQNFLFWKNHFWQIGQLLEFGLQATTPLLLFWWLRLQATGGHDERFWTAARWATAITFVGHGLYAAGVHPVPANFVLMVQSGLGVGEEVARKLLLAVGILDFVAALLLVLPRAKVQRIALGWIIPWAILTTLARLWSYGGLVTTDTLVFQWLPETVRRLPHVLVPMAIWLAGIRRD